MMGAYTPPSLPYVESRYKDGRHRPKTVVLFPTQTTSEEGAALGMANTWHSVRGLTNTGHYTIDERSAYRCVFDDLSIPTAAHLDKGDIGLAICADPSSRNHFWSLERHGKALKIAAAITAELCLAHNIKPRYVDRDRRTWPRKSGIRVSMPAGMPFDWPSDFFLTEVHAQMALKTFI